MTKPAKTDETRQFLSSGQLAAVELLAAGKNDTETAEAIGVKRQTVNEWRNHNPDFIAAVNRRRGQIWEDCHNRLRGLATKALDVFEKVLDSPAYQALPAAVQVLKAFKLYGEVEAPCGPTTPEAVMVKQAENIARERLNAIPQDGDPMDRLLAEQVRLPAMTGEEFERLMAKRELDRREALKSEKASKDSDKLQKI